jgi:hypothetical protein
MAFLFHCIFTIIEVGTEITSVWFAFGGFLLTEILPSLYTFYTCYQMTRFPDAKRDEIVMYNVTEANTEMTENRE